MENRKLESLVVLVPKAKLEKSSKIIKEIKKATAKCLSITEIGGCHAYVTRLRMTGKTSVKNIGITYTSNGKSYTKDYPKKEFYNL
jgi:hypothetical protein